MCFMQYAIVRAAASLVFDFCSSRCVHLALACTPPSRPCRSAQAEASVGIELKTGLHGYDCWQVCVCVRMDCRLPRRPPT